MPQEGSPRVTPLPHPCQRPFSQLSAPLLLAGGPGAGPEAQSCQPLGGHLDDHTTLLFRERQTVSGKVRTECQGLMASPHVAGSNTGAGGGVWKSLLVTVVTTNAFLVPTGGGASMIVGWRGAKKSSLNSASCCFSH